MGRLFGTDGARGVANTELTPELAMNIGRAAAMVLTTESEKHPTFLIGKDTRLSSDMLEGALTAGLISVGANVISLGVVPTPAVAFLIKRYKASAGIMISASHNSYEYNGIKIFSMDGYKLPDELEEQIESIVLDKKVPFPTPIFDSLGRFTRSETSVQDYIDHVVSACPCTLEGLRVALDCSNGSSSYTAQKLFTSLGAEVHMLFNAPDGVNINLNCGSTHIEALTEYVKANKLDAGLAFDGDADRCLAIDENGNLIDGDFIMAICANDLKERGMLKKDTVVGTVMTNMGFNRFCDERGLHFVGTKVGDRYVLEAMLREGYNLGGEQSGHVIFLDYCTTGDGQMTGMQLLSIMKRTGKKLSELSGLMKRYPQVLVNVRVSNENKLKFYTDLEIKQETERVERELGNTGRILVRVSGTEPIIRVMLEGEDLALINRLANRTAELVKKRLS